jgi:hypothetical protein
MDCNPMSIAKVELTPTTACFMVAKLPQAIVVRNQKAAGQPRSEADLRCNEFNGLLKPNIGLGELMISPPCSPSAHQPCRRQAH